MTTALPLSPIIVADDNPTDLFFLQRRLNTAGVKLPLQHVEDGSEAIRLLDRYRTGAITPTARPWLLFLDLKMPRMDGFEVLNWLGKFHLLEHLTVVILSTSDEPEDRERAFRLGAHRYLVKYPRPPELADVVAFALQRATTDPMPLVPVPTAS